MLTTSGCTPPLRSPGVPHPVGVPPWVYLPMGVPSPSLGVFPPPWVYPPGCTSSCVYLSKNPKRCARVDFPPTGLYERSFGLFPSDSYSFSSFRVSSKTRKRCARVDSPPPGLYEQSFGLIPLDSYSFSSFRVSSKKQKDAQGSIPPLRVYTSSCEEALFCYVLDTPPGS